MSVVSAEIKFKTLPLKFNYGDEVLKDLVISLGARDRASNASFTVIDNDLTISDTLYKWSRANGGIKIPAELSSGTTKKADNSTTGSNTSSGSTTTNGAKLEGLEDKSVNVSAFMDVIAWCEGTYPDGYNIMFTGATFSDFSDHPRQIQGGGELSSDAAGRYQFLSTTWDSVAASVGATDFSPKWQNICGWQLAVNRGAVEGNITDAESFLTELEKCAGEWASLPGSPYGQPTKSAEECKTQYQTFLSERQAKDTGSATTPDSESPDLEVLNEVGQFSYYYPTAFSNSERAFLDTIAYSIGTYELGDQGYFDDPTGDSALTDIAAYPDKTSGRYHINPEAYQAFLDSDDEEDTNTVQIGFTANNQDEIALWMIGNYVAGNAQSKINGGDIEGAITDSSSYWTNLASGSTETRTMSEYVEFYNSRLAYYDDSSSGNGSDVVTGDDELSTSNVGEEVVIEAITANGTYRYKFIYTDNTVTNFPSPVVLFTAKSVRYNLSINGQDQTLIDVSAEETAEIIADQNNIPVTNNIPNNNPGIIEQNTTEQGLPKRNQSTLPLESNRPPYNEINPNAGINPTLTNPEGQPPYANNKNVKTSNFSSTLTQTNQPYPGTQPPINQPINGNQTPIIPGIGEGLKPPVDGQDKTDLDTINDAVESEGNQIVVGDDLTTGGISIDANRKATAKRLIVEEIISFEFEDRGVVDEEPLYPVKINSITNDVLLGLKPEDDVSLDSVYNLIPDSLKNDVWVIMSISHNLTQEITSLELLKYIPVEEEETPGTTGGSGKVSGIEELKQKWDNSIVKVGQGENAYASGWVIAEGYIMTAAHMQGMTSYIAFKDGFTTTGQEIEADTSVDLMIVKVDSTNGQTPIPLDPDYTIYEDGSETVVYKIGHPVQGSRSSGGTGSNKDWDGQETTFIEIASNGKITVQSGQTLVVNNPEIPGTGSGEFVGHGDSGCPWFSPYANANGTTSGGAPDPAVAPGINSMIDICSRNNVAYTTGTRDTKVGSSGSSGGGGVNNRPGGVYEGFVSPSDGILTSGFGSRDAPTAGASTNHKGLDIAAGCGADIYAATNGEVITASDVGGGHGNMVVIRWDGDPDICTMYGHCQELLVSVGQIVQAGEKIALEGTTGTSTGCHLHFEVRTGMASKTNIYEGNAVDPSGYIPVNYFYTFNDSKDGRVYTLSSNDIKLFRGGGECIVEQLAEFV